jgi:hypothetical protein
VLVVEIDVVGPQALERAVDGAAHVLGGAIERADRRHVAGPGRRLDPAREFGRDHILVAAAPDRPPDQLLVGHRAVDLRGVEEGDAELTGALDGGDRLVLVGSAVEGGHAHATEAEGGDLERSKFALLHRWWGG